MRGANIRIDKGTERAVLELLKSQAEAKIYLFLLRKNGARSEQIIKGTKLHPSTVRELLSKMFSRKLIFREKLKNDSIGKNPYIYRATPPIILLQRRAKELEEIFNKLANLTHRTDGNNHQVKISIRERREGK